MKEQMGKLIQLPISPQLLCECGWELPMATFFTSNCYMVAEPKASFTITLRCPTCSRSHKYTKELTP